MKNIFLIPTDKSSKLSINCQTGLLQLGLNNRMFHDDINIYITSDEEIKDVRPHKGKWHLEKENILNKFPDYITDLSECKLVIMTTDQDLIKDGVQEIDDEFLEWFVKNPTCERVEIFEQYRKCCRNTDGTNEDCIEPINCEGWLNSHYERPYKTNCDKRFEGYKIIIPKEEPNYTALLQPVGMKQETLEEAAYNYSQNKELNKTSHFIGFKAGVKWQQERMYSEEEVRRIASKAFLVKPNNETILEDFDKWFEQFKKK